MRKRILISLITLILGISIYYLYKEGIMTNNTNVTAMIRNFVPDFLWMFSFYFFSVIFSKNFVQKEFVIFIKKVTKKYISVTAFYSLFLGIGFEIMQKTRLIKGTFDYWDITIYVISISIACLIEKYWGRKENEKEQY